MMFIGKIELKTIDYVVVPKLEVRLSPEEWEMIVLDHERLVARLAKLEAK